MTQRGRRAVPLGPALAGLLLVGAGLYLGASRVYDYHSPGVDAVYLYLGGGYCVGVEYRGHPGPIGYLPPGVGDRAGCR